MKIYVLFGQHEDADPGCFDALDFVWDEYCKDENPGGYQESLVIARRKAKDTGYVSTRLATIEVDAKEVAALFGLRPSIQAVKVEPAEG